MQQKLSYKRTCVLEYATIEASGSESNVVDCGGMNLMTILTPNNWTPSDLQVMVSWDGDNFYTMNNYDGVSWGPLTIPALTAGQPIPFYAHWFAAIPYMKINSVTPQSQEVRVMLALQPLFQGIHG